MKFVITDIQDASKPLQIASPRQILSAGCDAEISIGEHKKEFIKIKAFVSDEAGEGTAEVLITQNDRRASGKLTTFAGQTAELRTGDFSIQFMFNKAKVNR